VGSYQLQGEFAILVEGALQRSLTEKRGLSKGVSFEVILRSQARRKLNESFFFQA
jgi:hypothetical protein